MGSKDHFGAALVNQHGTLCWERADDEGSSGGSSILHGNVRLETEPFGDSYTVFMNGERPAGGVLGIDARRWVEVACWAILRAALSR